MNNEKYVSELTEKSCKEKLIYLMDTLDEIEEDNFFDPDWKYVLQFEL
jgi:hypothetical protein